MLDSTLTVSIMLVEYHYAVYTNLCTRTIGAVSNVVIWVSISEQRFHGRRRTVSFFSMRPTTLKWTIVAKATWAHWHACSLLLNFIQQLCSMDIK